MHEHHPHLNAQHRRRPPHHRAPDRIVGILDAMLRAKLVASLGDMVRIAGEIDRSGNVAQFLSEHCINLHLVDAIRQLEVYRDAEASMRHERCLAHARTGPVVIIAPVPPHLFDDFVWLPGTTVLQLDHHELPPSVRYAQGIKLQREFYDGLQAIEQADTILFDAYDNGGVVQARRIVAALLDDRHLSRTARLFAHMRPHPARSDTALSEVLGQRINSI